MQTVQFSSTAPSYEQIAQIRHAVHGLEMELSRLRHHLPDSNTESINELRIMLTDFIDAFEKMDANIREILPEEAELDYATKHRMTMCERVPPECFYS